MLAFDIKLDGDGCWPDIDPAKALHGELAGMASLADGMGGKASLTLRVHLDDHLGEVGPPEVHILNEGHSLCGFGADLVPGAWPGGHRWCRLAERGACATCERCLELAGEPA